MLHLCTHLCPHLLPAAPLRRENCTQKIASGPIRRIRVRDRAWPLWASASARLPLAAVHRHSPGRRLAAGMRWQCAMAWLEYVWRVQLRSAAVDFRRAIPISVCFQLLPHHASFLISPTVFAPEHSACAPHPLPFSRPSLLIRTISLLPGHPATSKHCTMVA